MIRFLLAVVLSIGAVTAYAAPPPTLPPAGPIQFGAPVSPGSYSASYTYESSVGTPEAPGTNQFGDGGLLVGGLCSPGTSTPCPNPQSVVNNVSSPLINGPLVRGSGALTLDYLIELTTEPEANWLLTISVDANTFALAGDIYEVTICNQTLTGCGSAADFQPMSGTTSVTCLSVGGPYGDCKNPLYSASPSSGDFSEITGGDDTYEIGITDLLEQYTNATSNYDNLPGLLDCYGLPSNVCTPADDPLDGGNVTSDNSTFAVTVSLTAAPEPASLALLGGAITLLGALRWSRRGPLASTSKPAGQG